MSGDVIHIHPLVEKLTGTKLSGSRLIFWCSWFNRNKSEMESKGWKVNSVWYHQGITNPNSERTFEKDGCRIGVTFKDDHGNRTMTVVDSCGKLRDKVIEVYNLVKEKYPALTRSELVIADVPGATSVTGETGDMLKNLDGRVTALEEDTKSIHKKVDSIEKKIDRLTKAVEDNTEIRREEAAHRAIAKHAAAEEAVGSGT